MPYRTICFCTQGVVGGFCAPALLIDMNAVLSNMSAMLSNTGVVLSDIKEFL